MKFGLVQFMFSYSPDIPEFIYRFTHTHTHTHNEVQPSMNCFGYINRTEGAIWGGNLKKLLTCHVNKELTAQGDGVQVLVWRVFTRYTWGLLPPVDATL